MAVALFIKPEDVLRNSIMDGNIDLDKYIQFIKLSQQIDIQNITGTSLYDKISTLITSGDINLSDNAKYKTLLNDYIAPMLIWYSQVNIIPFIAYQIRNGGIFKHSSETAETVSKTEVDYLVEKARTNAEWYKRRFQSYMDFNQSNFPEFTNNSNDQISPSNEETFNGWVL
ncbi:MAG: hypothetical protein Tp1138SUR256061_42 [Prokaryotic dsDNA virus sp.]|jgi:hypothetical protein|nr:MAG: hypothetical protein Tp1138SUR256061_42 [Prokaryotic dsDNA virus sp.]|tara:strand:+ start:105 stop:617 length:513 start_codon:yes stop_codon:yes gene_type:complete